MSQAIRHEIRNTGIRIINVYRVPHTLIFIMTLASIFAFAARPISAAITSLGDINPVYTGSDPWNLESGLQVGVNGIGALDIENGSKVSNIFAHLGYHSGSSGTVTVTGAGSEWNNSGDMLVGRSGIGVLNIENTSVVNVSNVTWVGKNTTGTGTINFNGGTLNTTGLLASTNELLGTGTINTAVMVGDIDIVFNATTGLQQQIVLDSLTSQNISINLDASAPDNQGPLGAGYRNTGTLTISDGLAISSSGGYLGYNLGSDGTATVTGGAIWNTGRSMYVGYIGAGTLKIEHAGEVNSIGSSYIGLSTGSLGSVTVTGTESTWNNTWDLFVGNGGQGSLDINDGGTVSAAKSYIGGTPGIHGEVTVTGAGSRWDNTGFLSVEI